jgi:hypothetical protein
VYVLAPVNVTVPAVVFRNRAPPVNTVDTVPLRRLNTVAIKLPPTIEPAFIVSSPMVSVNPFKSNVPPSITKEPASLKRSLAPKRNTPAFTVVPPVYVEAPFNNTTPVVAFTADPDPANTAST